MSRLILYPGGVSIADVSDDKIVRAVALSTEFKVFNFDPRPDLILDGRYQLGAESDQIELPGFVQAAVGGVMNAEYGVKTLFDSGGHTYFKLIAGDKFQANIFDAGQIEGIIPFEWSGRETISFLLQFDGDVKFYLYYDGIVYSFSQAGESPDQSDVNMSLISGRYERLDSFSSVSDVMSELEYLMKGTTLSGSSVANPTAFRAYEVYVLSDDGQINDENKTADFIDLGLTSDKMYAGFAGMKTTVNGRTLIDKLHDLSGNKKTASFTGNDRPEFFGNSICVEKASTNLFLNSDTLSTQGVTVTADPYTVSMEGTGSITFSGVHTGTLQGVSGQRVSVTFTPTAGTLTCTVSGTVTKAQIEQSAYATLFIPAEGTTVTRPAATPVIENMLPVTGTFAGVVDAVRPVSATVSYLYENGTAGSGRWVLTIVRSDIGERFQLRVGGDVNIVGVPFLPANGERLTFAYMITYSTNYKLTLLHNNNLYSFTGGGVVTPSPTSVAIGARVNGTVHESVYVEKTIKDSTVRVNDTDAQIKAFFEQLTFGTSIQTTADQMTIV